MGRGQRSKALTTGTYDLRCENCGRFNHIRMLRMGMHGGVCRMCEYKNRKKQKIESGELSDEDKLSLLKMAISKIEINKANLLRPEDRDMRQKMRDDLNSGEVKMSDLIKIANN